MVLLHELLVKNGSKRLASLRFPIARTIRECEEELQEQMQAMIAAKGCSGPSGLLHPALRWVGAPRLRYARVNTIRTSVREVREDLTAEGFLWSPAAPHDLCPPVDDLSAVLQGTGAATNTRQARKKATTATRFWGDELLDDVVVFDPCALKTLHAHRLVTSGALILQEKSSCLPTHALAAPLGAQVIDACAAPGNKTTHLAARLRGTGHVHAFDADPRRFATLQKTIATSGATNITPACRDFLTVAHDDPTYAAVTHLLVDPTCSGSGVAFSLEAALRAARGEDPERVEALTTFQRRAVLHALQFPSAQRVVYSTCSVNEAENEGVVAQVLAEAPEFRLVRILPAWHRRGTPGALSSEEASCCVRVAFPADLTAGFFLACFERVLSRKRTASSEESEPRRTRPRSAGQDCSTPTQDDTSGTPSSAQSHGLES